MSLMQIPKMTHPLSREWKQPDTKNMLVDRDHALMDEQTLSELPEYSFSIPSGVYNGKMWKRRWQNQWWLCWYQESDKRGEILVKTVKIILL